MVRQPHIFVVAFPAQGLINPALQFAKRLLRLGVHVTFVTAVSAHQRMNKSFNLDGLSFATFSDGFDDGIKIGDDISEMKHKGSEALNVLVTTSNKEGHPVTCMVYTLLLPWAATVARELHIPSALLWPQPATVFDIYYYYFNGYADIIKADKKEPSRLFELPGLPPLTTRDLPSFFVSSSSDTSVLSTFEEHLAMLKEESDPKILVNTFNALEPDALRAIEKFNLIGIGPLIPSAFLDGKDPSDTSFGGDLFKSSKECYIEWLNSKHKSSVVYVSFGSISVLSKQQMKEIARGLLDSGFPFLWVIREEENGEKEKQEERLSCREELEKQGMIVPWCSQLEVLTHPSLGCFLTHCGWNSSMESLISGVPVVAFPQWTDQGTNAKLIEDVWKTGVRVKLNEEGIVGGDEIKRCLDLIMGNLEMRENAKKWKSLAQEAMKDGGTSYNNLKDFVDDVVDGLLL